MTSPYGLSHGSPETAAAMCNQVVVGAGRPYKAAGTGGRGTAAQTAASNWFGSGAAGCKWAA